MAGTLLITASAATAAETNAEHHQSNLSIRATSPSRDLSLPRNKVIIAHISFMIAGWMVVIPLGALLARYGRTYFNSLACSTEYISCNNPPPGLPGCPAPKVDWVEGVAIIVAILIVDLVGSLNDYQKERQFAKLNAKKEERNVKVIRQGKQALMSVHDVLVGD
ncbi:plasma membrane calcium, partial [Tilletia horrida]